MDLGMLEEVVLARERADLAAVGGGTAVVAGATWMMSERQIGLSRLVDITTLDWPPITVSGNGLEIAATCTLTELRSAELPESWSSAALLARQCCDALLSSFKVQRYATVGGNICLALPAGAMTSLCAALDGEALVWAADGTDYRIPVREMVIGNNRTSLRDGDVVRSIHITAPVMSSRTSFRKIALAPRGRSGAVMIGRVDPDGTFVLTVSAATDRPFSLMLSTVPVADDIADMLYATVPESNWYDDAHGAPDWRRRICGLLARDICEELA